MDTSGITQEGTPLRRYLTIKQATRRYNGIFETEGALRNLIFKAFDRYSSVGVIKGNGLGNAVIRLGRKVVLDEEKLVQWVESHKEKGTSHA